jgi:hypothetical protein
MKRRLLEAAALTAICLALVVVRVVWSARVEWQAARAQSGDEEVRALGRAARLYAPGNPYSRRALDRLAAIGRDEPARALPAWREVRSAILATRSFYTPHPALLAEANAHIADLMADAEAAAGRSRDLGSAALGAARSPGWAQARAWHAARLAEDYAPSVGWTVLALVGLAGWIGCAVGLLLRGLGDDDRLRPRVALAWAAGTVAGLALFFVGLSQA